MHTRFVTDRAPESLAVLLLTLLAGCATTGGQTASQIGRGAGSASRRIPGATVAAVQPVAERVFRQHFRINPDASGPGRLMSQPQEATGQKQPEQVRDVLLGSRDRHRHLAELYLDQQGPDVVVRCTVLVQRLETSARAAFNTQRGDDRPTETPIDRLGPTSTDNREEWVPVKRNRELEQEILTTIAEDLRPTGTQGS
jgi:hypothetical protein